MTCVRNVYFHKTIAAYGLGYLGALRVTLKTHMKHTSQMQITDFDCELEYVADTQNHRVHFAA